MNDQKNIEKAIFNRTERLVGAQAMERIGNVRVIVFGVGGVGSWCAESLVRSGVRNLTIVDSDRVCITNVNRQLQATLQTVGKVKTDVLKERLLTINPQVHISALRKVYTADTADSFDLDSFDYVIDAIDSLQDKALLILRACRSKARLFSSMGAALKLDPTRVSVAEFWKVRGCPLAAALRRKFKKQQTFPSRKFKCVFSEELLHNCGEDSVGDGFAYGSPKSDSGFGDPALLNHEQRGAKAQINGTLVHITGIFGFTLAGLVLKDILEKQKTGEL